jgi:hypothetical protein
MPVDRDTARARVARTGLTAVAIERVARASFARMPITLVDRARQQLRRFFSEEPWTVEDDVALSALVGPGEGWTDDELAPGVRVRFGWRGGSFKVDVAADEENEPSAPDDSPAVPGLPVHQRTLGDTFDAPIVIEGTRRSAQVRFITGPGLATGMARYTRANAATSPTADALFRAHPEIEQLDMNTSVLHITLADSEAWSRVLLPVFDTIAASFPLLRPAPADRQYERAIAEIGDLDVRNPRELARVIDATTSPDVAFRRLAVAMLEAADPLVAVKPWARALEDSSRGVKRAAMRAMANVGRTEIASLYERALYDGDACVRYYALRGLAQVGTGRVRAAVEQVSRDDDDIRVRLAARAALDGALPQ